MEIIANDDKDVTPAQAAAFAAFMAQNYPNTPILGHGEVNPGHKERDEGQTAKAAALAYRRKLAAEAAAKPATAAAKAPGDSDGDTGGADTQGNAPAKRVIIRTPGSSTPDAASGGPQSLYDSHTGQWIPGSEAGYGAEGGSHAAWADFRRSANIEEGEAPPRSSIWRRMLSRKMGFDSANTDAYQWVTNAPKIEPNQLSADAGMASLIRREKEPLSWGGKMERDDELNRWAQFDRSALSGPLDRNALNDNSRVNPTSNFKIKATLPPGTEMNYSGTKLLAPNSTERRTDMGPSVNDTAQRYMSGGT